MTPPVIVTQGADRSIFRPTINVIGPGIVTHDMPCPVCISAHAVFDCNEQVFKPCWKCRESWELRRIPWWRGMFTIREWSMP